jgi:hypothetical protein
MKLQFNHTLGKCQIGLNGESHLPLAPTLFDIPGGLKLKWIKL